MGKRSAVMLVGVAAASFIVAACSGSYVGEDAWFHGTGTQHFEYGDGAGTLDRTVEAWVAADGRYRVVVVSSDDSASAEEFIYDGTDLRVFITPPHQPEPLSMTTTASPRIFAVEGFAGFEIPEGEDLADERRADQRTNLPTYVYKKGIKGASYEFVMEWQAVAADPTLLEPSEAATDLMSSTDAASESSG